MSKFKIPQPKQVYHTAYKRFRGVDFSTDPALCDSSRSPFAPNLISDAGGMPEKRIGWRTLKTVEAPINGIFSFDDGSGKTILIHAGTGIYRWNGNSGHTPEKLVSGVKNARSQAITMNEKLVIFTGDSIYCYGDYGMPDGVGMKRIEENAYIPTTSIGRNGKGGGTGYEETNLLTAKRKNTFLCDGQTVDFQLDREALDDSEVTCRINGAAAANFTVDRSRGILHFSAAPAAAPVTGKDNMEVTFGVATCGKEKILRCTIGGIYAGRLFLSGNPEAPAMDYRSGRNDFSYFPDLGYTHVGGDAPIMGYALLGEYQAIIKKKQGGDATIFLRQESTLNGETVFTVRQGVAGVGAVSKYAFAQLQDEPLFLSEEGIFGICSVNLTAEKSAQNRSWMIDRALKKEPDQQEASAVYWQGRYLLALNGRAYLLDGTQGKTTRSQSMGEYLYECFHWENIPARCLAVIGEDLYFGTTDGRICRMNNDLQTMERFSDDGAPIICAWTTKADDDGDFTQYKTMQRRGSGVMIKPYLRSSVKVSLRTEKDFGKEICYETMDIFDWMDLDFSRVGFLSNDAPQVIPFGKNRGRYLTLQITVKNDGLNEGFGVYGIEKKYTKNGWTK